MLARHSTYGDTARCSPGASASLLPAPLVRRLPPVHVELAVTTAQATPGVKAVRNELLTDTDIELDAANRLALDPRLRLTTDQVSIASLHGSLLLSGRCDTAEQKAAALEIATYVPGVVEVVDGLKVGPQPPRPIYRRKPAATPTPAKGHH